MDARSSVIPYCRDRPAAWRIALAAKQGSERGGIRRLLAGLFELRRERLAVNRVLVDVGPDHYARPEAVEGHFRVSNSADKAIRLDCAGEGAAGLVHI